MWPGLFRALDGNIETGMARNGKWVYRGKLKESDVDNPDTSLPICAALADQYWPF